ncbi:hypothetical protein ACFQGW_10530 [Xanthomonas theicola]|uniref:hypothetical protein n=1 Tax=Xanthomonas theicola TaxID=56464 RepID=UPI003607808E
MPEQAHDLGECAIRLALAQLRFLCFQIAKFFFQLGLGGSDGFERFLVHMFPLFRNGFCDTACAGDRLRTHRHLGCYMDAACQLLTSGTGLRRRRAAPAVDTAATPQSMHQSQVVSQTAP